HVAAPGGDRGARPRRVPRALGDRVPGHRVHVGRGLHPGAGRMTAIAEAAPDTTAAPNGAAVGRRRAALKWSLLGAGVALSAVGIVAAIVIGTSSLTFGDAVHAIWVSIFGGTISAGFAQSYGIVTELRLPRVLLAFAAGAGLSLSGVIMQGLLRNPL